MNSTPAIFVGRAFELQQLNQHLKQTVEERRPHYILVQGDYGVGKTALIERFLEEAKDQYPEVAIGRGRCAPEIQGSGLAPFSHLLADLLTQESRWKVIGGNLWEFTKKVAPAWLDLVKSGLGKAAATTLEESYKLLANNQTKYAQSNLFTQFIHALSVLTEKTPTIGFIDDLHWSDETSLYLLRNLANNLTDRPVLLIFTYRPVEAMETGQLKELFCEMRAELLGRYGGDEITLQQGINVKQYTDQRYKLHEFPESLIEAIQVQTEGHALFVNQLFSWWEETEIIRSQITQHNDIKWVLTRDVNTLSAFPPKVGAILDQRLHVLSKNLKDILARASVEGEDFTAQTISKLLLLDELQVYNEINSLERSYQLIHFSETKDIGPVLFDFYRFTHRFIREHIYTKLSPPEKRALHKQVGECLEQLFFDPKPVSAQLFRHFQEAGSKLKAARYSLLAAQNEQSHYSWLEAENYCSAGMKILENLPLDGETKQLKVSLLNVSGDGFYNNGEYKRASERYTDALKVSLENNLDAEQIANLYYWLADCLECLGEYEQSLKTVEEGKAFLTRQSIALTQAKLILVSLEGLLHTRYGRNELASELLRHALFEAEQLPETPQLLMVKANIYNNLAIARSYMSHYEDSIPYFKKAIELYGMIGYKNMEITCMINLVDDYTMLEKFSSAETMVLQAVEIARQIGDLDNEAYALATLGLIYVNSDYPEQAIAPLQQAIQLWDKIDLASNSNYAHADLAQAYIDSGNISAALEHANLAIEYAEENPLALGLAFAAMARVQAEEGQIALAEEYFERSLEKLREDKADHYEARVKRQYAEALLKLGKPEKVFGLLQEALIVFRQLDLSLEVEKAERVLERSKATINLSPSDAQ